MRHGDPVSGPGYHSKMASGDGDAAGDVIEPARGSAYAKWLLLGLVVCAGFPALPFVLLQDKSDEYVGTYWLIVAIGMSTVLIASSWGYVRHGSHKLVVTDDELVYTRSQKTERHRRAEIASVRISKYLKSHVISVCTPDRRLVTVDYTWWGRRSAERLAELLDVPLSKET